MDPPQLTEFKLRGAQKLPNPNKPPLVSWTMVTDYIPTLTPAILTNLLDI